MRKRTFACLCLLSLCVVIGLCHPARAEAERVRVGTQFGMNYLPLFIMQHDHLWEKHAAALGITLQVEYARMGGGAALNDALLSGAIQVAAGGTAPMLLLWDRTDGRVVAFAGLNQATNDVLCNRPGVHSIADLTEKDRIAMPAIKSSMQAIILMALSEKTFGEGQAHRLDDRTVTMQHPDALTALVTRSGPVTTYIASSPYQEMALKHPGITKLADNTDAFGGPATLTVVYGQRQFTADNPLLMSAFYRGLSEAFEMVAARREDAIDAYLAVTQERTDRELMREILTGPDFAFAAGPVRTLALAQAMHRFGVLRHNPQNWSDYFAEALPDRSGS